MATNDEMEVAEFIEGVIDTALILVQLKEDKSEYINIHKTSTRSRRRTC